ncbi:MAG: hypothetical protein A3F43_04480 [Gammaproteobacteria bacterium RIFCSPHIGHO2_12_FULL_42_10]|nr:MAG: hypothetical protein A3F43_04480 [Gammaproteobacteria bacterium RIFCSPHIGHO2_12_FULL_42_10]
MTRFFAMVVCLLGTMNLAYSLEVSAANQARYTALIKEVRCVVCQNQSLADSNAPLAEDLRDKIYMMMLEKKSDTEIKDYLVKRYGEFVLLRPRFSMTTFLLWTFPAVGIVSILLLIYCL